MANQGLLQYNDKLRKNYFNKIESGYLKRKDSFDSLENHHSIFDVTNNYTLMEYTHGGNTEYSKKINKKYINNTDDLTDYYSLIEDNVLDLESKYGRYENYLDYIVNAYGNVDVTAKVYSEVSLMDSMKINTDYFNEVGYVNDPNIFVNYEDKLDGIIDDTPMGDTARRMVEIEEERKFYANGNGYNSTNQYIEYSGINTQTVGTFIFDSFNKGLLDKDKFLKEGEYRDWVTFDVDYNTNNKYTYDKKYQDGLNLRFRTALPQEEDVDKIVEFYLNDFKNHIYDVYERSDEEKKKEVTEYSGTTNESEIPLDKFAIEILNEENELLGEYDAQSIKESESPDIYDDTKIDSEGEGKPYPYENIIKNTQALFSRGKINTFLQRYSNTVDDVEYTHGRKLKKAKESRNENSYCRSWNYKTQYDRFSRTIRGSSDFNIEDLQNKSLKYRSRFDNSELENGAEYFKKNTVLLDNTDEMKGGIVRIIPSGDKYGNEMEHTMLSIENLAWKDVLKKDADEKDLSKDQRGPNGGRIMWFPPYNLKFQENVNVQWNQNSFIGRGENVYTYTNTNRMATLSFSIIIDHPSIINSLRKQAEDISEEEQKDFILRYFAGDNLNEVDSSTIYDEFNRERKDFHLGNTNVKNYLNKKKDEINDANTGSKVDNISEIYDKTIDEDENLQEITNELVNSKRYSNEYEFFESLKDNSNFLYDSLVNKFKNFNPAFHSMSPEGFASRLTFLQQCTRQGHTISTSEAIESMTTSAANLSFGRMPVVVLRIGDFINTRAIIESMSIDYSDTNWDLNPEGCGVQPMYANVSLNIVMLGGQTMDAPVSRLQNAVSFNYYANTGVYDDRADRVSYNADTRLNYEYLYTPNMEVANTNYSTDENVNNENSETSEQENGDIVAAENINGSGDAMSGENQTSEAEIEKCERIIEELETQYKYKKELIDNYYNYSLSHCVTPEKVNSEVYTNVNDFSNKIEEIKIVYQNNENITSDERSYYIEKCNEIKVTIKNYGKNIVDNYTSEYNNTCG